VNDLEQASAKSGRPDKVYHPELDILRFVAFLLVFLFHVTPAATAHHSLSGRVLLSLRDSGAFGVCIFFALSSFLITRLLIFEKQATGSIHFKAFYARRILRIWPLYLLFIGLTAFGSYFHPAYSVSISRIIAFLFIAGNWYVGSHGFGDSPLVPLWSISVEEQYYLLWPPIVKYCGVKGLAVLSVIVGVLSYGVLAYLGFIKADLDVFTWTNTFVQFQFFAAGSILAVTYAKHSISASRAARLVQILLSLSLLFMADFLFHVKTPHAHASLSTPLGYLFVLAGTVLAIRGTLGTVVPAWTKPLIYLGKISYGLYVFHYVTIDAVASIVSKLSLSPHIAFVVTMPISFALTIAVAAVSYKFFESPFLRLKERFTFIHSRNI
jgi:peptidoglycan/LPS O-acetylase OafA/YrhL